MSQNHIMSNNDHARPAHKRVAIVGGGAAGMSAAFALSMHPDMFDVTLYERSSSVGGMATSTDIDQSKYGASYINDGVQGASPVFYNTYAVFDRLGFQASKVGMQVSFGKDAEKEFWSNVFPSRVIDKFGPDIKKFGKVLKVIKALEPIFALVSVQAMLKMFGFSKDFGEVIVYPLVALFFGTGNQTPFISSAILERVFMDPSMRLFEYSPTSFLASIPEMRAFPKLSDLYSAWRVAVESKGNVRVRTEHVVTRVRRSRSGHSGKGQENGQCGGAPPVELWTRTTQGTNTSQDVINPGPEEVREEFDELILAVDADAALKILGEDASWLEKKVLGNVKYLWDVTVTHNDVDYMKKYYRLFFDPVLRSSSDSDSAQEQYAFAEKSFKPLYYIRSYESNRLKMEMSFDLTEYQPQFKGVSADGNKTNDSDASSEGSTQHTPPHVFQTIFLDKESSSSLWSKDEVAKDKVILEKWWKQQSHRWQHYAGTVPWMMFINGKRHTHFAGAWTILNMHEIAVVSGFAAAYKLGADYPFAEDQECKRLFRLYLVASHGTRMRSNDRKGFFA